jgi:methylated-DNA-protein-cysteine methyltransferase-like protein
MTSRNARVFAVVRRVPRGRVATYGQVARLAGLGRAARQVGYALHALNPASSVPWHRVVNARGTISLRSSGWEVEQRLRLEREGVRFDAGGRIALGTFGWTPAHSSTRRPGAAARAGAAAPDRGASHRVRRIGTPMPRTPVGPDPSMREASESLPRRR